MFLNPHTCITVLQGNADGLNRRFIHFYTCDLSVTLRIPPKRTKRVRVGKEHSC